MPRDYSSAENSRKAKARRAHALSRNELRQPSAPRDAASGPTSMAVKRRDADVDRMVAEFEARRAALVPGTRGDK